MIDGAYAFQLTRAFYPDYRTHKETGAGTGASEATIDYTFVFKGEIIIPAG